jgi:hypothetical protein
MRNSTNQPKERSRRDCDVLEKGASAPKSEPQNGWPLPVAQFSKYAYTGTLALVSIAMMPGCATDPHQSCNVDSKWHYIRAGRLNEVNFEARRLVSDRSISELVHGEVVQKWFRAGENELLLCRQSYGAMNSCDTNYNRFVYDNGAWRMIESYDTVCTD